MGGEPGLVVLFLLVQTPTIGVALGGEASSGVRVARPFAGGHLPAPFGEGRHGSLQGGFAGGVSEPGEPLCAFGFGGVHMTGRRGPDDGAVGQLHVVPVVEERLQKMMRSAQTFEVGDKSLIRPSPVGSFGLKGFHREPTVFWCCGPGYGVCSGSVNRL